MLEVIGTFLMTFGSEAWQKVAGFLLFLLGLNEK